MKVIIDNINLELVEEMVLQINDELNISFKTTATLEEVDNIFSLVDNLKIIEVINENNEIESKFKNFVEYISLEKRKQDDDFYYIVKLQKNDLASDLYDQITDLQLALAEVYELIDGGN